MKAYSKSGEVPKSQEREARARRQGWDKGNRFCRGYFVCGNGQGQLSNSADTIEAEARELGAKEYFWFHGSVEAWLDGEPYERHEVK